MGILRRCLLTVLPYPKFESYSIAFSPIQRYNITRILSFLGSKLTPKGASLMPTRQLPSLERSITKEVNNDAHRQVSKALDQPVESRLQ